MNQSIICILFGLFAIVNGVKFIGCTQLQQNHLYQAISDANKYASSADSYMKSQKSSTPRYTTWFGAFTSFRHNTIANHFAKISMTKFEGYTYDCSTCTNPSKFAYVYPEQFGKIYLCGAFWNAPITGTDSNWGTIISMASKFIANGGTEDYAFGQSECKALAQNNPDHAISNADNHRYFAENNPLLQ